jgi:hypothetical protein
VSAVALPDRPASQPTADAVPPGPGGRWRTPLRLAVAALFLAVIAVTSRLLFVVGDVAWSAVAVLAARRLVRPPGPPLPPA